MAGDNGSEAKVIAMELDLTTPEGRKKQGELILQAIKGSGFVR
jgi:hypothetical protein